MLIHKWNNLIATILSLWLIVAGYVMGCVFVFSGEAPRFERLQIRLSYGLAYIVIGLGPAIGYLWLMKRRRIEIDYRAATVMVICASTPIWLVLFYLF